MSGVTAKQAAENAVENTKHLAELMPSFRDFERVLTPAKNYASGAPGIGKGENVNGSGGARREYEPCQDLHPNCLSELHVGKTYTWKLRPPTAKELTLDIMQLQMQRHHTRWYQFVKRFKIQVEIDNLIITARAFGYFEVGNK